MIKINTLVALLVALSSITSVSLACDPEKKDPVVSRVHWITIHTLTPGTFDSLCYFMAKDLGIPVFFGPETYGSRRYTAIYTGNVILEICGPFEIDQIDEVKRFTRYNTLSFRPYVSGRESAGILEERGFGFQESPESSLLNISVTELCTDHLPVALSDKANLDAKGEVLIDSLKNVLRMAGGGPLGLEHVEEVYLGYETEEYLWKWQKFLSPLESASKLWILPEKPNLRFVSANREEIKGLVFKVKSLEQANFYLQERGILKIGDEHHSEIDIKKTGGIRIVLVE